jgi:hypothetical protein
MFQNGKLDSPIFPDLPNLVINTTKNRFLRELNTNIWDMLLHETYNSLPCLVELASKIEIQLALSEETIAKPSPICENKNYIDECHLLCVLLCLTLDRINRIWLHTQ